MQVTAATIGETKETSCRRTVSESGSGTLKTRQVRTAHHVQPPPACVAPIPAPPASIALSIPRPTVEPAVWPPACVLGSWPSWLPWARRPAALRSAPARPTARRSIHATLCTSLVDLQPAVSGLLHLLSCAAHTAHLGTPPCRVALCTRHLGDTAHQPDLHHLRDGPHALLSTLTRYSCRQSARRPPVHPRPT